MWVNQTKLIILIANPKKVTLVTTINGMGFQDVRRIIIEKNTSIYDSVFDFVNHARYMVLTGIISPPINSIKVPLLT